MNFLTFVGVSIGIICFVVMFWSILKGET